MTTRAHPISNAQVKVTVTLSQQYVFISELLRGRRNRIAKRQVQGWVFDYASTLFFSFLLQIFHNKHFFMISHHFVFLRVHMFFLFFALFIALKTLAFLYYLHFMKPNFFFDFISNCKN